ncbi:hypothetical protein [Geosporobacter ferrireducens]|uniref:Uncharacterized protein n=1 Tax=Geosporobacter ferrireducens TaxID=1424294 RepID=A0A1D8GHU1_9FIRM|nr:hypothetical protein [Geosporobacter ferrireducens]AOT70471.1 hypothetical protein Gferi_13330 [Geosporobacter ferrireducens]MTI57180.1 hypothetical protein [Geosporobacter ferrireducens]
MGKVIYILYTMIHWCLLLRLWRYIDHMLWGVVSGAEWVTIFAAVFIMLPFSVIATEKLFEFIANTWEKSI